MATYASRPAWELKARAARSARVAVPLGLGLLLAVSLVLRTRQLDVGYWIDEGLSVGIADRPLTDIPGVLKVDGSPPLYYMLLHVWMGLFNAGEQSTHVFSLLFALACVPVGWWSGRVLFGVRTAWIAALLAALNPWLTTYAQEARMYSLTALLGWIAMVCFLRAFALLRYGERVPRGWLAGFAVSLAAMMYTHNWALFFAAACGVTWLALIWLAEAPERRALVRDGLWGFGGTLLLYAPWIPTLMFQAAHTGAPWSKRPTIGALGATFGHMLGYIAQVAMLLAAGAGVMALLDRRRGRRLEPEARVTAALVALGALTLVFAWLSAQASPAWAVRYLAVALPPLVLLCAAGLAHAGPLRPGAGGPARPRRPGGGRGAVGDRRRADGQEQRARGGRGDRADPGARRPGHLDAARADPGAPPLPAARAALRHAVGPGAGRRRQRLARRRQAPRGHERRAQPPAAARPHEAGSAACAPDAALLQRGPLAGAVDVARARPLVRVAERPSGRPPLRDRRDRADRIHPAATESRAGDSPGEGAAARRLSTKRAPRP